MNAKVRINASTSCLTSKKAQRRSIQAQMNAKQDLLDMFSAVAAMFQ